MIGFIPQCHVHSLCFSVEKNGGKCSPFQRSCVDFSLGCFTRKCEAFASVITGNQLIILIH